MSSLAYVITSCSTNALNDTEVLFNDENTLQRNIIYNYTQTELETLNVINEYRKSLGLTTLQKINYISTKSAEHDDYMISMNVVSHDNFIVRSEDIKNVLGAETVAENIAWNFNSAESVVAAWLKSESHKKKIMGNFTHFGIAIKADPTTGKNYITNIFAKIN
ncbi:CAP domain-containing protein [Flavobacterium sp. NG2]|uniref:CAP domain-containing protein n=1 Tax=Flavobacterium sp. NG2 TaxID=3097547 RepID=UPI002A829A8E|nr:CAP domain-containing protein [Flavobacterium sp. NG2]WPR70455.1 CAP domain-containing protein [Flavobacterium sp. NG2]